MHGGKAPPNRITHTPLTPTLLPSTHTYTHDSVSTNDGLLLDVDAYRLLKERVRQRKANGGGKQALKGQGGACVCGYMDVYVCVPV